MKTLRFALVATIVAFVMVSSANADDIKSKPKFSRLVNTTLNDAQKESGLVLAIYQQVDESSVLNFPLPPITVVVKYNGAIYRITGTRLEWLRFFRVKGISPCEKKLQKEIL